MEASKKNIHLSLDISPKKYILTMQPDLQNFTFDGEEDIVLEIKKATKTITLHAYKLQITEALFNRKIEGAVSYDEDSETITLTFPEQIKKGEGTLHLKFAGELNNKLRGFYRSTYYSNGKKQYMATTQFEATDARWAFPCFDEPARKAIFCVNLIIPKDHTAISNTIETETKPYGKRLKIVRFAPTPIMSTYLLAFLVGKFEHIEKKSPEGVMVRVFVTPGKKKLALFALDAAVKTLSFFTKYFKVPYPLPVLDMIAIPDFSAGAMENWGAITYRETALLIDPDHSSTANKQRVALVVGHELAHQWFGNLVTMDWWTHLWLNEGFASYIEYLAVDNLFPEWEFWTQFVSLEHARALELDGLQNTHPIEVEIEDPKDINEIFDAVSYSKGASVIRMIAEYLGYDNFKLGLQTYLKKHAYKNASTIDLWNALEEVSGKPVKKIVANWTQKPGYPLLSVSVDKDELIISQSRFFSSLLSEKKSKDKTKWIIPINSLAKSDTAAEYHLLDGSLSRIPFKRTKEWLKLNSGEKSLVRIRYSSELLAMLKEAVVHKELGKEDRFGIIRDLFVLAEAGKTATDQALQFSLSYKDDDAYIVWIEIASELAKVANLIAEEPYAGEFNTFARELFAPISQKVVFKSLKDDTHEIKLLRSLVLSQSSKYGDQTIITKAQKYFQQMLSNKSTIDVDLRGAIYKTVARAGDERVYDELLQLYRAATLDQEKDRLLSALSSFNQESLMQRALELSFTEDVRPQDAFKTFTTVGAHPKGKYIVWKFLQEHWEMILEQFSGTHIISRFITPIENFTKKTDADEVQEFFKERKAPGANQTIKQVTERIESNDAWLKRDSKKIETFLKTYKTGSV